MGNSYGFILFSRIQPKSQVLTAKPKRRLSDRWWTLLELVLLILAVWAFCSAFLDLGEQTRLPGNEAGLVQSLDYVFLNSLQDAGKFPLWNAALRTGVPFIADPLLHVYNPLVSLPVLLLGVQNGFKLALFLSFLAAALGMWFLGRILGIEPPCPAVDGADVCLSPGSLWRVFSRDNIPSCWALPGFPGLSPGCSWLCAPGAACMIALAALALGLLLVSGNIYYAFYMLVAALLFAVGMSARFSPSQALSGAAQASGAFAMLGASVGVWAWLRCRFSAGAGLDEG